VRRRIADPNDPLKLRAKAAGLVMNHRMVTPPTRRAHEAAEFAREQDRIDAFHAAVLKRYWTDMEDISSTEVLRGAAVDAGLDADALQTALDDGRYTERVLTAYREAVEMGVNAVPTFLVGDQYVIQGAQSQEVFEKAMGLLGAARRS
jgi:predicted DsbA family dithiol-disulfide isomerase